MDRSWNQQARLGFYQNKIETRAGFEMHKLDAVTHTMNPSAEETAGEAEVKGHP